MIDDPERDFRLKFDIFKELSSREEGRPAIKQEIEGAITAPFVVLLPEKNQAVEIQAAAVVDENTDQANYEVIGESAED